MGHELECRLAFDFNDRSICSMCTAIQSAYARGKDTALEKVYELANHWVQMGEEGQKISNQHPDTKSAWNQYQVMGQDILDILKDPDASL